MAESVLGSLEYSDSDSKLLVGWLPGSTVLLGSDEDVGKLCKYQDN